MKEICIEKKDHGKRIDRFLEGKIAGQTKREIQRLIKQGNILVNNEKVRANFLLEQNDVISFGDLSLEKRRTRKLLVVTDPVIISETNDYLVIQKPAGLIVHPSKSDERGTLRDWVLNLYPALETVGESPLRPGMMHRLDKGVSGLMVIAKSQDMYQHLKKQFQKHEVKKEYVALVHGKLPKLEGIIDRPISRSSRGHRMASRSKNHEGKDALTEYAVRKYIGKTGGEHHGFTLVDVMIHTGRTHQIRAHMQSMGHPVVGDELYKLRKQQKVEDLGRVFLHAARLGFFDRNMDWVVFECDIPSELQSFLTSIT